MPADMENATDLAVPPTVTCKEPIQLNYQNELASQDIYCYLIRRLMTKNGMMSQSTNFTVLITREIKCISMKKNNALCFP